MKKRKESLLDTINFKNQDKSDHMKKIWVTLERFTLLGRKKITYEIIPIGKEMKHQFWIISSKIIKNKQVYDSRFNSKELFDIILYYNLEIVIEYDKGEPKLVRIAKNDKLEIKYVVMQLKNLLN